MTVMARVGFILNMSRVDCDTAGLFFRGLVDLGVIRKLGASSVGEDLGDGGG